MRLVNKVCVSLLASSALVLAACGGDDDGDGGDGQGSVDPAGTHYGYVLNEVKVPASANEASQLALDIDGDDRPDNALGGLLASLATTAELDLQGGVDEQINAGGVIILADVQATDLSNATGVGLQVFLGGNASPAPCMDASDTTCGRHLDGNASFSITEDYDALVVGRIVNGSFSGGPGNITIELALDETSTIPLTLVGARVEMSVTESGLTSGKLGGAILSEDVDSDVIPAVVSLIDGLLEECDPNATPCCPAGSTGETVLAFFDANEDCMVPQSELEENNLIASTIRNPDLDLIDASGNFNPNDDGEKDAISLGVGFSAVTGDFTAP